MKKQKNKRKNQAFILALSIIILLLMLALIIVALFQLKFVDKIIEITNEIAHEIAIEQTEPQTRQSETEAEQTATEELLSYPLFNVAEESIYTFSQGPKAYNNKIPWGGSWCEAELADSRFSIFGCGLCDLANIYSTLTPYECSPVDMYYHAKEVTDYSPGGGYGAIDWPFLKQTLEKCGFSCSIKDKDPSYRKFQSSICSALTAIVLVSSANDNSYWPTTEGHYVNIWAYDPEDDTVFLADSGDPSHNRSRIPLRTVYNALKTAGEHQYLLVYSYDEDKNDWKYSGISEKWICPKYYKPKQASS